MYWKLKGHKKMHITSKMDECQKMLPCGKPIKLLEMEQKLWNVINCPNSAGRRGHGYDNQSLGNFDNFNSFGWNDFFATSKFFARFCNQAPKVKYCHEFTKGDFSQSTLKEVKIFLQPAISTHFAMQFWITWFWLISC